MHTGNLESIHSLYNKYVPKRKKFELDGMQARIHLAALDHNNNATLEQAVTADGDPKYKQRYSKAAKSYVLAAVKAHKDTNYRKDIMHSISETCSEGSVHKGLNSQNVFSPIQP